MAENLRRARSDRRSAIIFVVLVLSASSLVISVAWQLQNEDLAMLAVLSPTVIAGLMTGAIGGRAALRELFVSKLISGLSAPWVGFSIGIIPVLALAAVLLATLFDGTELHLVTTEIVPLILMLFLISIGEEFGWRGFLQDKLQSSLSMVVSSVIVGSVWAIWHYPPSLVGIGTPQDFPFWGFMLWVIPFSIIIGWVYFHTKNILLSIVLHTSANASFNYLPILPENSGMPAGLWSLIGLVWLAVIVLAICRRDDFGLRSSN